MKKTMVILPVALLALSMLASANTLTLSAVQTAQSGDFPQEGEVNQLAVNYAAVMGENNNIRQASNQSGYGIDIDQYAKNNVVVSGSGNIITQGISAAAMGLNSYNGSNMVQDQKNLLYIIGDDNTAIQFNRANAYNGANITFDAWIYQTQRNIGVMLGSGSSLDERNVQKATMETALIANPIINQTAKNLGFVVGDNDFSTPDEEWGNVSLSIDWPDYSCSCPEIAVCECPDMMSDLA